MTLVMTSLPLVLFFQCLFTFALVLASRWLAEIWQLSWRGATGELEVEFNFASTPSLPPRRQRAPESLLADEPGVGGRREKLISHSRFFFKTIPHPAHLSSLSRAKIWANPASRVADPTNDWNPEFKFHLQKPEFSSWNPKSTAWNPESKTVLDSLVRGVITCEWQNRRFVSNKCVSKARYNVTNKKSNFGKLLGQ